MSQLSYPSAKSPTDVLSRLDAAAPVFRGVRRLTPKLVIVTEIIAPYRIPVLNALARRPEIELESNVSVPRRPYVAGVESI